MSGERKGFAPVIVQPKADAGHLPHLGVVDSNTVPARKNDPLLAAYPSLDQARQQNGKTDTVPASSFTYIGSTKPPAAPSMGEQGHSSEPKPRSFSGSLSSIPRVPDKHPLKQKKIYCLSNAISYIL